MNILIVSLRGPSNANRRGGAQDYIQGIAVPWTKEGHSVKILCGQEKIDGNWLPESEIVDGIDVKRVGTPSQRTRPLIKATKEQLGWANVIIENIMAFPLLLPLWLPQKTSFLAIKHHFQGRTFITSQGVVKGSWGIFLESGVQPLVYRGVPIIANSVETQRQLKNKWIRPSRTVTVIPPGFTFLKGEEEKFKDPTIFYVGALNTARKKVDELIEAFKQVHAKIPQARLIIAGDGRDRQLLEKMAAGLPIQFLGFISEAEKHRLFRQSWLFASPSVKEGFGITWIEANAHGLPAIVYDLGLDTVNESCAKIVPLGDVQGLAEALLTLLEDEKLRTQMSIAAIENAKRFDWHRSSQHLLKVVTQVATDKAEILK